MVIPSAIRGGAEDLQKHASTGADIGNLDAYLGKCIINNMKRRQLAAEGMQKKEEQYNAEPQKSSVDLIKLGADIFK
jgi:hypothetical protein